MSQHRNDWRRTTALFALTSLIESLAFGHLSAFTPLFLQELRVPFESVPFWTGFLSALAFVIGLPLLPFWGVWADRYGRKLMIVRSSVVAALIYALTAASTGLWMLALTRLLAGFVFGNTGIMMALQAEITPREKLGTAVALISAGPPVGMAAGPYLGGIVVERWGIRTLLYLDAALTLVVIAALALMLREEPRSQEPPQSTREGVIQALRGIVTSPSVSRLFAVIFLLAFGLSATFPYVPILIQELHRGPGLERTIGALLTVTGVTMALLTPLWGRAGDRAGHLGLFRFCAAATAVCLAGHALSTTTSQVAVWRIAIGIFLGGLNALNVVLLAFYTPPDRRSSVLNLSLLPQQLAWFLGPLAGSAASWISLGAPFWLGAVAVGAGFVATFWLRPPETE